MSKQNFEKAKEYALHRLENELSPGLYYHGLVHTRDCEHCPGCGKVPPKERVCTAKSSICSLTAAWFHDLGFIEVRSGHEAVGARLASEILPGFGYDETQIQLIQGMIMATAIPQSPHSLLEQILADASLDVLGRDDFMVRNTNLRRELAFFGQEFSDLQWFSSQLKFRGAYLLHFLRARIAR